LPENTHLKGAASEICLAQFLTKKGYWVFSPIVHHAGPVDLVAISPDGEILLLDAKSDARRSAKNTRIHRARTKIQKMLGVKIAYVSADGCVKITDHKRG